MRRPLVAILAVASLWTLTACSSAEKDKVEPPDVTLGAKVPEGLHLGVIVTLAAAPGEGSEWVANAAGAQVATYQYQLGGEKVTLDVVDDRGTAAGAEAAVAQLVGKKVSGIVAATTGAHVRPALAAAGRADTAVLLPYETASSGLPDNAWLTGPGEEAQAGALQVLRDANGWSEAFVVTGPGRTADRWDASQVVPVGAGGVPVSLAKEVARAKAGTPAADVVVVDAPAEVSAKVVRALQAADTGLPILLSRDAMSPAFSAALEDEGGALSGELTSVGVDAGDVTAVSANRTSEGAASFFQALRLATADDKLPGLLGQGSFRSQAAAADIASHDAVVALVTAASEAGSRAPGKVLAELDGLKVTAADGLGGPALDFSAREAVPADSVTAMKATTQDPGVRPAGLEKTPRLFWFAVPTSAS